MKGRIVCPDCDIICCNQTAFEGHLRLSGHSTPVTAARVVPEPSVSLRCVVCSISCQGQRNLDEHLVGRNHRRQIQQQTSTPQPDIRCHCCDVNVHSGDYSDHVRSKRHLKKSTSSAVVASSSELVANANPISNPPGNATAPSPLSSICAVCKLSNLSGHDLMSHLKGLKHRKAVAESDSHDLKLRQKQQALTAQALQRQQLLQRLQSQKQHQLLLQRLKQVIARLAILTAKSNAVAGLSKAETGGNRRIKSEANQRGVEVDWIDGIDFGFTESASLVDGFKVSKNVVIKASATLSLLAISPVQNHSPYFRAESSPRVIAAGARMQVPFHFAPARSSIGRFHERFHFQFRIGTIAFSITRRLRAQIGSTSDGKEFGSVTPYVKQKRNIVPSPKEGHYIPGQKFKQGGRGKSKETRETLKRFAVPMNIRETLEWKNSADQLRNASFIIPQEVDLNFLNYTHYFSSLLNFEQCQMEIDICRFDLSNATLQFRNTFNNLYFVGPINGLEEKRPSVLQGDPVLVKQEGTTQWYQGIVHKVESLHAGLKFDKSFKPAAGARFLVRFKVCDVPLRRMLQCMLPDTVRGSKFNPLLESLLFPSLDKLYPEMRPSPNAFFNFRIRDGINRNVEQFNAVNAIVNKTHDDSIFILFGPPGTGKTVTLVESILQLAKNTHSRILIVAPSNSAADLLATRLAKDGGKGLIHSKSLIRVNAMMRDPISVPKEVEPFCSRSLDGQRWELPDAPLLAKFKIVVTTCSSSFPLRAKHLKWDYIFVDEAAQASEPELLIPLSLATAQTSVIIAGDHKQLSSIVLSSVAKAKGLETSLLERLMNHPNYNPRNSGKTYVKLVRNYRSHPAILKIPNEEFYEGELEAYASMDNRNSLLDWSDWPAKNFPVVFYHIDGKEERGDNSPSYFNVHEITRVNGIVNSLIEDNALKIAGKSVKASEIGIISPYSQQVRKLRNKIGKHHAEIKIGSTEEFQGQERRVIIISTVRSSDAFNQDVRGVIGFLANEKRFNVAITRAQAGLIICGNAQSLALDPMWKKLLLHIQSNGAMVGAALEDGVGDKSDFDVVDLGEELQSIHLSEGNVAPTGGGSKGCQIE